MATATPAPPKLYKYRGITDYTGPILTKGQLYFSAPKTFNDPFDCRVTFSPACTESRFQEIVASNYLRLSERLAELFPGVPLEEATSRGYRQLDSIVPDKAKQSLYDFVAATGVYCLTQRPESILMWSHYAANHTGICVEFSTQADPLFENALPVSYGTDCPVYECFNIDYRQMAERALCRKAADWEYEKEWRIVGTRTAGATFDVQPGTISGVILGALISDADKERVRQWLNQMPVKPTLSQARLRPGHYIIDIEPS